MAIRLGAIEIVLRTELDQFTGGMRRAASEVDQQGARIIRATGGIARGVTDVESRFRSFNGGVAFRGLELSALRANNAVDRLRNVMLLLPAALGGTAAALGTRQLTELADEATRVRNRLNVVVSGTAQRVAAEEQIFDIAQRTRQEYGATAQMFSRTMMAAQNLGRSQGEVLQFVEAVQKTNLISGSTTQEATSAAIQLSQGLASNRLQGDELRSVLENNVSLTQILAQELAGGNVGRLREMGSEGALTAQAVMDAVLRRRESIDRQFSQSTPMISQGLTYLNNALIRYVGILDQASGASERLGSFLRWVGDNVPGIASAILGLSAALVSLAALRIGSSQIGGFFSGVRGSVANARTAAASELDASVQAVAKARENQVEAARQAAAARDAVRSAAASPILAIASPAAVQQLFAAESKLAQTRQQIAAVDERIAALTARRAAAQQDIADIKPGQPFYRAAFNLSGAQAEVDRGNQLLHAARQVRAQFEAEAAKTAGQAGTIVQQGMSAYARSAADVERQVMADNERRASALRNAERAFAQQSGKVTADEDRRILAAAKIDQDLARAQAERQRLQQSSMFAVSDVQQARSRVEASAEQRLADLKKASEVASRGLADADRQVAVAAGQAADANRRFAAAASALTTIKTGLAAAGQSLVAFLGGPWGVAFALASAAVGVFAYQQARAAEDAQRHKRALDGLPEAIKAVEEAQKAAVSGRPQPEAAIIAQSKLEQAREAQRATISKMIEELRSAENPRAALGLLSDAGAAPAFPVPPVAGAPREARRRFIEDTVQFSQALNKLRTDGALTTEQIDRLSQSLTRAAQTGNIKPAEFTSLNTLLSQLRANAAQIEELTSGAAALRRANALAERAADDPRLTAAREEHISLMRDYDRALNAAAITAKAAEPAFKAISEEVMKPLTEGASGFDLAQRTGISEQAKKSIQEYTAAMAQLSLAAGNMPDGPLRNLVAGFVAGAVPIDEFKTRLDAIRQANPDMTSVIRGIDDAAKTADTSKTAIDSLQRTINALTGKTVDIFLRISQIGAGAPAAGEADGLATGLPSAQANDNLRRIQQHHRVEEELRRSRQSRREYGIEELARRLGVPASDPRLSEIFDNNDTSRGGGDGARDARQYAKTLRELREEAASFTLSDVDRETVRYSRTARVAETDVKAFIDAMAAGRTNDIPPRIRAIREELEKTARLRTQKDFRDRYATDEERYIKEMQKLQQAGFDDATFQQFRGRLARSIFGDPGGDLAKGFTEALKAAVNGDWQGALRGFGQRFLNVLADVMFKPLERQLAELFRSIFDQIMPTGSGLGGLLGLGSLFAGGGGGITAGVAMSAFSFYHGGGIAGSVPAAGVAPAGLWNSAPRYHSGLRAGELRAVLLAGERVLTQADSERTMKTMAGLSRAAATPAMGRPVVNIINQGPTQPEVSDGSDGSLNILIPAIEAGLGARASRREGSLYGAMGHVFGVPANGGLRGV